MGRLIGLALCENIPLGIPLPNAFFKLLTFDGIFASAPTLVAP
jgi:hypothetical protein